jgi:hypothetical protein
MFKKIKYFLLITGLAGCFYACVKKKTFSQSPVIEYKSFTPLLGDTAADLVIGFSDGDGDIGKEKEDKANNLFITYYYFDTLTNKFRAWYDSFQNDTLRIPYTVRKPIDDYSGKPISGEVAVKINQYRPTKTHKRIKYVMYILDNADHKSNLLTTPELQVP